MLKSRSGVARVAIRVRSGGGASGPCTRSSGVGPAWAREMQARTGHAAASAGNGVQCGCPPGHPGASTAVNFRAHNTVSTILI